MNDHLLYLASTGIVAFTCLLVSGLLLSLKTLRESTIPKYRTACKYLALASALVGIGHIFILSSGTDERTIMELFYFPILLISASQALLFTFLLTLLFRGKNVTRRNILLHAYDRAYRSLHDRLSLPGGCPYVSFRRMVG